MKGKCFKKKLRGENKSRKANKNKTWNKSNFKKIYQEMVGLKNIIIVF